MDDNPGNPWVNGVLFPAFALVWGISSLASREIIIPFRRFRSLPIYDHIPVHGWPAMSISVAVISIGLCLHFSNFWGRYPKCERFSSRASVCTGWAALILFAIGIWAWLIEFFCDFCR
jgi:hypothetical protein